VVIWTTSLRVLMARTGPCAYLVVLAATIGPLSGQVFERDIQPIFAAHCGSCHSGAQPAAGLDLTSLASALKGGANGAVLVKGASEKSALYQKISSRTMPPPKAGKALSDEQIRTIQSWIDNGLGGGRSDGVAGVAANRVRAITEKDRDFWAFRKPVRVTPPKPKNSRLVRNPIDAFLLAKLESKGLTFSPEASKETLLRRAYLDLLGLPPSPQERAAFLADHRPDAYERLIDSLLASPHYGERWGRHWLDVAGYTDEQGFASDLHIIMFNEGIWHYRDYVIQSFNNDKPYDRFLIEQLAGDELADWRNAPKFTPEIREALIATGYLRLMQDLTDASEVQSPPYYYDVLSRVVDNFTSGVLGLTGGCARCHDHKYDPIRQKDYYSLVAVFARAYNPDSWMPPKERYLPDVSKTEMEETKRFNSVIDRQLDDLNRRLHEIQRPYQQKLFESKLASAVGEALRSEVRTAFETPVAKRTDVQKYIVTKLEKVLRVAPEEVADLMTEYERKTSSEIEARIKTLQGWRRSHERIEALWDVGQAPTVHVLQRGVLESPGIEVKPAFIEVLSEPGKADATRPPDAKGETSGMRLALARWLTRPDHPLTSRVMVNRVWMHHFGRGIVNTPENFGRRGAPPSHPELLDWLAVDFVENGWKLKRLHKMIMTSTAYRQSSHRPAGEQNKAETTDPDNELLWRMNMRRLEAEAIRDSVIAVSGKLDRTLGGKPVSLDWTPDGLVTAATENKGHLRRSIYLMARRTYSSSMLDVFNFPTMNLNCTQRVHSATPLQSLTMLNSRMVMDRAADFAARVVELTGPSAGVPKRIETAFILALGRVPTADEVQLAAEHMEKVKARYIDVKTPVEEAEKRALANFCQSLFNLNEFLFID